MKRILINRRGNLALVAVIAVSFVILGGAAINFLRVKSQLGQVNRMLNQEELFYGALLIAEARMHAEMAKPSSELTLGGLAASLPNENGVLLRLNNLKSLRSSASEVPSSDEDRFCGRIDMNNGLQRKLCLRQYRLFQMGGAEGACLPVRQNQFCPAGYAAFGFTDPAASYSADKIDTASFCCRVPADLLTNDHKLMANDCRANGEQRVVTGGTTSNGEYGSGGAWSCYNEGVKCYLRCTLINTQRYRLGTNLDSAFYYQEGTHAASGFGDAKQILRNYLPVAMRFGTSLIKSTAVTQTELEVEHLISGCVVPSTSGTLMTKKSSKYCHYYDGTGMFGAQLFYTGSVAGDVSNQVVQLLPNCSAQVEVYATGKKGVGGERYHDLRCTSGF